jgi:transposase
MPKALPREFRDDVVAVARKGQAPVSQIAKDFGISESCLHRWVAASRPSTPGARTRSSSGTGTTRT